MKRMTYYNVKSTTETFEWQRNAKCKGMGSDQFYSPENERAEKKIAREKAAKEICRQCGVRVQCGEFALNTGQLYGIWGGMTEAERAVLHRKNKKRVS